MSDINEIKQALKWITKGDWKYEELQNSTPGNLSEPPEPYIPAQVYIELEDESIRDDMLVIATFDEPFFLVELTDEFDTGERYNGTANANALLAANAPIWLASLITTIESQKEEIEKQKARATEYLNSKIDTANAKHMLDTKNKKLQTEIESLKAITELAVKGLEEVEISQRVTPSKTLSIARTTLYEIERLQNGTT